ARRARAGHRGDRALRDRSRHTDADNRMSAASAIAVEVPDIGDFQDVPIIEILVSPGDSVAADDPLLTLESDKATMDVPAPFAGEIKELMVKVGDTVSQGTALLTLAPAGNGGPPTGADASAIASQGAPSEAAAPDAVQAAAEAEAPADGAGPAEVPEPAATSPPAVTDGGGP